MTAATVFISSKRIDSDVEEAAQQFREAGFIVQIREVTDIPDLDSPAEEQERTGAIAARTIEAIRTADAVVVLNGIDWGRSLHEERGIAVAFGKPVITLDQGAYRQSTPLDFHPLVRPYRSMSVSEAIERVIALRNGTAQPPQSQLFVPMTLTGIPTED